MSPGSVSPWAAVGLGNPGEKYAETRHNIGAMVLQQLASQFGARLKPQRRVRCDVADGSVRGQKLWVAVPNSYMNESGGPTSALVQFYKVPLDQLILIQDEIDLPFGSLRVKFGGGDNGHNGLRSVRQSLSSGDWFRVRMGVGRASGRGDAAAHVLSRFSGSEPKALPEFLERGADAVESLVTDGLERTQSRFNS